MVRIISLIIIFILLIVNFLLARKFKITLGRYNSIDAFLERERANRLQELNRQMEAQRQEMLERFEEERARIRLETEEKRAEWFDEIDAERKVEQQELITLRESLRFEEEQLQKAFEIRSNRIMEDASVIEEALKNMKEKHERTIEAMKEQEKEQDEIEFHRIVLTSAERHDIELLKEVEKKLHNKDILRKLIYKSYIEVPMNEMFARIGVESSPGIYKIENINNKKTYIGQSTNLRNRLREHIKSAIGISSIASQAVHNVMAEEGIENFLFTVLDPCGRGNLNEREKYWIDFYKSNEWGYNRTRGGS